MRYEDDNEWRVSEDLEYADELRRTTENIMIMGFTAGIGTEYLRNTGPLPLLCVGDVSNTGHNQ
jgi:hypothetical protein